MPKHTIRLSSAWEPIIETQSSQRIWMRRFGRPAGLGAEDRVILFLRSPKTGEITLNTALLPPLVSGQPRWQHDITLLLSDRNVLSVRFVNPADLAVARDPQAGFPEPQSHQNYRRVPLPESLAIASLEIGPIAE